jgi:hypothetical protein
VKRIAPLFVVALLCALLFSSVAWAASAATRPPSDRSPAAPLANALSTTTGIAISPLLGTSALGAYQWVKAGDAAARAKLPWYAQPKFWVPALLIVAICAAKDALGAAVPAPLKKPLDTLEVVENKFSGLIAAGAVVPFAMDAFARMFVQESGQTAVHATSAGLAMMPPVAMNWAPALDVLMVPLAIAIFAVVWMASHAINVLILLSPWGAVDAGLKAARTALLGLLTLTATINPWVGALLSLVVIVIAYFVAGWAFRLTVFGSIMSWDFLTGRRHRFVPAPNANLMFASGGLPGVPVRTYGRLIRRDEGALEFAYRPWLVRAERRIAVPASSASLAVGAGLFFSIVISEAGGALFLLPLRYRGHEATVVERYGLGGGVKPAGLRKAWHSLRDLVGGRAAPAAAT